MEVTTRIALSEAVLLAVEALSREPVPSRSAVMEDAIRAYLRQRTRDEIAARDLDILDRESGRSRGRRRSAGPETGRGPCAGGQFGLRFAVLDQVTLTGQ